MRWIEPSQVFVPQSLQTAVGGHPLVAQALLRRGFATLEAIKAFLDPGCYQPAPFHDLPNLPAAMERLLAALRKGERICIWGDFDVDGQTATTILLSTLEELGATVRFHIPHREQEGHGIRLSVLRERIAEGMDLLLTCDTGVTAHAAIAYAREQGVDVIVTDHHDLPAPLPDALAIVNPKLLAHDHPLRELPGAGVAYELAESLYHSGGRPQAAEQNLDLLALSIVADVAVLTGDVRYLLQRGLRALRETERLGLQALMETAEITPGWLTEEHIGYALAPRLNSLGRLADANVAVEFLTTNDPIRARVLATELEGLNAQRQLQVHQVMQGALSQIERDPALLEDAALVLAHPAWPGGVIGIVAGRLAERFRRPVLLLTVPAEGLARGSARSVPGCNITAAFTAHSEMLERFGGHPMAAGLTIEPARIPEFRRALSQTVRQMLTDVEEPLLQIDAWLQLADLSLDLVQEIERLAPFGPGNLPLVLATRGLSVQSARVVGRNTEHRLVTLEDGSGVTQRAIWWQGADQTLPEGKFDLVYAVRASNYRGQRELQVEWIEAHPVDEPAVELRPAPVALEVVDYRQVPNPRSVLEHLRAEDPLHVWCEADARTEMGGRDRNELVPSRALAIWTTPPGPDELREALARVSPEIVYLFGIDPGLDDPGDLLQRVAGLVKRTLRARDGELSLAALAAATAQREATVRLALSWLEARGHIAVVAESGGNLRLREGVRSGQGDAASIVVQLRAILSETAAYRSYFRRADHACIGLGVTAVA